MAGYGKHRGYGNRNRQHGPKQSSEARQEVTSLAGDSPVLALFKETAFKLNERQDRHERLVKLSRDLTIESKRIIFLLHSSMKKEDNEKTLQEATERLNKLIQGPIRLIGLELENSPAYLHSRAVSPGLQEFIEAYTFCYLMKKRELVSWVEVQEQLKFSNFEKNEEEEIEKTHVTLLPMTDYMLGLADLSGELMRKSINSIANSDTEECLYSCQVVRDLFTGFIGLFGASKEIGRKLNTTRNNVAKVENAVYALKVRGDEAPPKHLIAATNEWEPPESDTQHYSDDKGFFES